MRADLRVMDDEVRTNVEERVQEIARLLEQQYGRPAPRKRLPPLDELILTILSQHTSDANSDRAFESLLSRFGSWEAVRDADPEDVAAAIRQGGLARVKAPRIVALLRWLSEERGSLDLDFLMEMDLARAREFLLRINGVGPKTAACVLLFSCGLPAFPVDTHVHRVARRLGLIGPQVSAEEAHRVLESVVPAGQVYSFHVSLITHGRKVCKAPRPLCDRCALAPRCDYFNKATSDQSSAISSA